MNLKSKLKILRFKWFCLKWSKCVILSFNQQWILCNNKKCPLSSSVGLTRAYKKTIGIYKKEEDLFLTEEEEKIQEEIEKELSKTK